MVFLSLLIGEAMGLEVKETKWKGWALFAYQGSFECVGFSSLTYGLSWCLP